MMTNQRLYTNKAMAIGAVIDALDCDEADITDIHIMMCNRMGDYGYFVPPAIARADHDIDDDDSKDAINEDSWATVVNFTGVLS